MLLLVVILAFVAGALLVVGLASAPSQAERVTARLEQIGAATEMPPPTGAEAPEAPHPHPARSALRRLAGTRGVSPETRRLLDRAGRPLALDAAEFTGLRLLLLGIFLLLAPLAAHCLGTSPAMKALVIVLDPVIGLALPQAWLQGKIGARQAQIRKALPDALDLLVVSMEAGVAFDAAVALAASKMRGPLAGELGRALQEMRLGRTRAEALREMAARAGVAELTGFVAAVTQADRLGSGLAHPLRVQSETVRTQRVQRVREAAARLPTRMLFPLVFFLLPALFVVILGPGIINLLRALNP